VLLEAGFEYDAEAKLQYMVYPSGKRVKYTYDDLARHTGLKNVQGLNETDIVNNLTYGAAGELKSMSWINSAQEWASQSWTYNNRLQMTAYTYGGPGGAINHSYLYSATQNDGKLQQRQDNVSGEVVQYQYDSIHRLISASASTWSQSYVYDGFGNMKQKIGTGAAALTSFNIPLNSAKNGASVSGDPGDIDNRILSGPNGETYQYAPDNKRVAKTLTGAQGTQWFLWVGGMRIGTYTHNWNSNTGTWYLAQTKEDLYVAGRRVAPSDRLGSDLTDGLKLMPYGEELQPPNVPNDRTKFATYHRDASGLDYADQRYNSPGTGRFMTSDPYLASGGAADPSSWNRYAYVEGDPVNKIDASGMDSCRVDAHCVEVTDTTSWIELTPRVFRIIQPMISRKEWNDQLPSAGERRVMLWKATQSIQYNKDDCGALAGFAALASASAKTTQEFISDFGLLTPEVLGSRVAGMVGVASERYARVLGTSRTSTYRSQFRDSLNGVVNNADQGHHFAFYFQIGASLGLGQDGASVVARLGELLQGQTNNLGDERLAIAAATMGGLVAAGKLSPEQLASEIQGKLCDPE
jgi:RHS repeat-associated protein